MAWVNWSGYVPEIPGAWAFGRTPYRTYEDAMAAWTGAGNDPAAAEIKWYPYPPWGETEADRPGTSPTPTPSPEPPPSPTPTPIPTPIPTPTPAPGKQKDNTVLLFILLLAAGLIFYHTVKK